MRKIILVLGFVSSMQILFAQQLSGQNGNKTIDSLKTVLANTSNPMEQFDILNTISQNLGLYSGDIDSANCLQLLQIAQKLKNDSLLAISYNLIGEYVSRIKGDNTSGLEYYFKAVPLAEKAGDKRRLSSLYFDISLIYFSLQNNEESVNYIRKGGANLPDTSHPLYPFMLAQYQRGMATYFVATNQSDSALFYAQPLILTSRKLNSPLFQFSALFLTGAAYGQQGDKVMAEAWFNKAAAISDSVKSVYAVLRFGVNYIPFLLEHERLEDAKVEATHVLIVGKQLGNNDLKLAGAGFMRQVFEKLNNTDSAYYYSRMEAEINAQIFSQANLNKIQALAFNEQIRTIEEEARQRNDEEQRKQNLQYVLIALGIIVLISLYLSLSRSFMTNTKLIKFFGVIALLIVFEFLNLLLHPFLERITHHSPLLMLLALVCIAALLVPLHHTLEHWATTKLVEKNKKIRLAAAKKTIAELEKNNSTT